MYILQILNTNRYLMVFAIFALHSFVIPNLSWYTAAVLRLMYFDLHVLLSVTIDLITSFQKDGEPRRKNMLWVANHYSYLDALLIKIGDPELHIVAKSDLMSEVPDNVFTRFMLRVFNKGGFIWYDRNGSTFSFHHAPIAPR